MAKADENIKPKSQPVAEVEESESAPAGSVSGKQIRDFYNGHAVSYQEVADKFNVRLYDVRKLLDEDFRPDPGVEAGEKVID